MDDLQEELEVAPVLTVSSKGRLVPLATCWLVAIALVAVGIGSWSWQAGLIVAGALFAVWAWLILGDVPDESVETP